MAQVDAGPNGAGSRRHHTTQRGAEGQPRSHASPASPEGRFVAGPGKALCRHLAELRDRAASADARLTVSEATRDRAEATAEARKDGHRGGDRTWLLRPLIPVATLAEGVTAYVGMEVLVPSRSLAVGLAALAALVGTGMAAALANRRLNQLPVPAAARVLEVVFVVVLTLLRYDSLHIQGADLVAAAGGAALAALISALGLLGIEEILVETQTFGIFLGRAWAAWKRWRCARADTRLSMIRAQLSATADKLAQQFVRLPAHGGGAGRRGAAAGRRAQGRADRQRSCAVTRRGPAALAVAAAVLTAGCSSLAGLTGVHTVAAAGCPHPDGVVLVIGAHRDVPAPSLSPVQNPQVACLVSVAISAKKPVWIVVADGQPAVTRLDLGNGSGSLAEQDSPWAARDLHQVEAAVAAARPESAGADDLAALDVAADAARAAGAQHAWLVLLDSGLNDRGALDFTVPGVLGALPSEVASQLRGDGDLPRLRGFTVVLAGLGYTAPPQPLPSARWRGSIAAIWAAVAAAAGARVQIIPVPVQGPIGPHR